MWLIKSGRGSQKFRARLRTHSLSSTLLAQILDTPLLGIANSHMYCSITKEKIIDLCCNSSMPLGVDDPRSQGDISNLIITLYDGAGVGTIASNFTTIDQQK